MSSPMFSPVSRCLFSSFRMGNWLVTDLKMLGSTDFNLCGHFVELFWSHFNRVESLHRHASAYGCRYGGVCN